MLLVSMTENVNVIDSILLEVGEFGRYQRRTCFLILIFVVISFFSSIIYVFETKQINHRCEITGCDVNPVEYTPVWWTNAIPSKNSKPSKCSRFKRPNDSNLQKCEVSFFNRNEVEECKLFVYETNETSIMQDFDLHCEENIWKLTLPGTIHSCGTLIGLPIFGILSDRFGRKRILIYGIVLSGVLGLTRSFANSYTLFIILEFFEAICTSGLYPTVWILGSELVSPNKRVLLTLLFSVTFALGGVIEGFLAWALQSWRTLLRFVYTLHIVMVCYYWIIPESVMWLLARKRVEEAKHILQHIANVNGKTVPGLILKQLEDYDVDQKETKINTIFELLSSITLMLRLATCAVCWICCLFLYNGLTINSMLLSGNSYMDFILTMVVEIPGSVPYIVVDKVGRRLPLAGGFAITALACVVSIFIPTDFYWLTLCVYLLGKFSVSVSICVIYSVTTEVFPTSYRSSLLSVCVMFGSLGLMAAPQMPLLESFWKPLPLILFSLSGILATILSLLLPETMNVKLPNTIEEAERIGKVNQLN